MTNRAPTDHRVTTAEQSVQQPKGNPRPYRSSHWPQAERLQYEDGGSHMIAAMMGWRTFNAKPVMCVANDNYEDADDGAEQVRPPLSYDNLMFTQTAKQTIKLQAEGEPWRPEDERFDIPHRNSPERSTPAGIITFNGAAYYQAESGAEDEANRVMDCRSARRRLGHVCCRLLDLASADSTTEEIAHAVKQPMSERMETYIDWSIIRWIRDDAYWDYAA